MAILISISCDVIAKGNVREFIVRKYLVYVQL